ncbi:MAG: dipeptide/oligopeptide/nickel ABC transporter ATP-binding protein [Desulfovibrio sp.]|jgi:nickel transport system ATP-binding protein|nr:dipeptide/oligopeptide/nickel ABC transporter ATP-binding protein [Desulfovibrio sp.]
MKDTAMHPADTAPSVVPNRPGAPDGTDAPPLLELRGVTRSYRTGGWFSPRQVREVLRGVDLTVREGGCTGVVGPSGAGKSTLCRIALGLEQPDGGMVRFMGRTWGRDVRHGLGKDRRHVQVVFQNSVNAVNPRLTVERIIGEPLENFTPLNRRQRRARAGELLEQVHLSPALLDRLPHRLSGGQLQRVCIARALAPRPRLILLDEALSSLDMLVQARVLDLLAELRRATGTAYLFVTHDVRLVPLFCDEAAVLTQGRVAPVDMHARRQARAPQASYQPDAHHAAPHQAAPHQAAYDALRAAILPAMPASAPR